MALHVTKRSEFFWLTSSAVVVGIMCGLATPTQATERMLSWVFVTLAVFYFIRGIWFEIVYDDKIAAARCVAFAAVFLALWIGADRLAFK